MIELKPCPWCGNKNVRVILDNHTQKYYAVCSNYQCTRTLIHLTKTEQEAIEYWNGLERDEDDE